VFEFRYLVEYKGGPFIKTVYARDEHGAQAAIQDRYKDSPDFTVIRLLDPGEDA
jgi:hypothetical protein